MCPPLTAVRLWTKFSSAVSHLTSDSGLLCLCTRARYVRAHHIYGRVNKRVETRWTRCCGQSFRRENEAGVFCRSKKDKGKGVLKGDPSDPEPEGLTLLVPDIQRTAEIVRTATVSLRQASQGGDAALAALTLTTVEGRPLSGVTSARSRGWDLYIYLGCSSFTRKETGGVVEEGLQSVQAHVHPSLSGGEIRGGHEEAAVW